MKIAFFSTKLYDREYFNLANKEHNFEIDYFEAQLNSKTLTLASGYEVIIVFVHDQINSQSIKYLTEYGLKLIALRCSGFNNVDLKKAYEQGVKVVRVPSYSPNSIAEHTVALLLTLIRKTHKAYNRVREGDFSIEGLLGFNINSRTIGIIGTGRIGKITARILSGFGCKILAYDPYEDEECKKYGLKYVDIDTLFIQSDIISLHCPLTPDTYHLINEKSLRIMKDGVGIINTSRGAVIDSFSIIEALKSEKVGFLGLDVYEEEADLFYEDLSDKIIKDDMFARLLTFPNVLITSHQGFFTKEAMENISKTTLANITEFCEYGKCLNEIKPEEYIVEVR
jgi:D-lactate dehydrogenase